MVLLFWPLMLASIIVSIVALSKKKPFLLVISCFLIIPLSFYLAATPSFRLWGLIFPILYLGAAFALKKNMTWLSVLFISPIIMLIGWLGYIVINQ